MNLNVRNNIRIKIVFLISAIVFVFSAVNLIYIIYDSYNNKKLNNELSENISQISEKSIKDSSNKDIMDNLSNINDDIKGSIKIKNTKINYPIVQNKDNQFYINHNAKKNQSKYGSIFIDCRNKLDDNFLGQNIILYGHNMRDGSMFADLQKFRNKKFFNTSTIDLEVFPKKYKFKVFSIILVNSDFNYRKIFFDNDQEIQQYLKRIKSLALYFKDIKLNHKDTIITLSTCSYDWKNSRIVVLGKLIKY